MNEPPLEISCQEVKSLLDQAGDFALIDCREADEYAVARIEAARLLPMSEIQQRLPELEPDRARRIVIHCHHGGRSLRVAKWLRQNGFAGAQSMSGGIDEWATSIDPTVPRY